MASVLLSSVVDVSAVTCRPTDAVRFLKGWFGQEVQGYAALFCLPSRASMFYRVADLIETLEQGADTLDPLVWPGHQRSRAQMPPQNVYIGVGLLGGVPEKGRGRADDVQYVPGVWADLDVKPGGFESEAAVDTALAAIAAIGLPPSIVARSGSTGGAHAYWRVPGGLSGADASRYSRMLHGWLEDTTGVLLDDVSEANRVLRLPGTIWFPKSGKSPATSTATDATPRQSPRTVRLLKCDTSGQSDLDLDVLERLAGPVWAEREAVRTRAREEWRRKNDASTIRWGDQLASLMGVTADDPRRRNLWGTRFAVSAAEEEFARVTSWDEILIPAGWVLTSGSDSEGRRQWMRPGGDLRNPRSIVTDWEESPNVASLLSMAPETGLRDLYLTGKPLTKARVAASLLGKKDGDVVTFLTAWLRGRGT